MSLQNVEMVRALQPGPDVDVAGVLADEVAAAQWIGEMIQLFAVDVQGTMRFQDVPDAGDRGVVVEVGRGRQSPTAPETSLKRAAIWTVGEGLIPKVDFNVPYVWGGPRRGRPDSPAGARVAALMSGAVRS